LKETLKEEILHFVQDDKEKNNGVILKPCKESPLLPLTF
jgi:hypothetical protein